MEWGHQSLIENEKRTRLPSELEKKAERLLGHGNFSLE